VGVGAGAGGGCTAPIPKNELPELEVTAK